MARQRRHLCELGNLLIAHGIIDEGSLYPVLARQYGVAHVTPEKAICDPAAINRLGVTFCGAHDLLPLQRAGSVTVVATSEPHAFAGLRNRIEDRLGPVAMVVMTRSDLRRRLQALRRHHLVRAAETRVPHADSCRDFDGRGGWIVAVLLIVCLLAAVWAAPVATFSTFAVLACTITLLNTLLLLVSVLNPPERYRAPDADDTLSMARLPRVSILVPLFHECEIATTLVERLSHLEYPRELLDVCLVIEECDAVTRDTLARSELPLWIRTVAVPDGSVRTKPRAMNYALDFCKGEVIGIYDAEDAPSRDQLLRVVHQFARSAPDVGCLQGRLNFYNARASWLTRCFAIDYAAWFGLILPVMHRLGWPIPLGGTTVFFRRDALRSVGAWDAHNVTEDADLGMRLARRGFRTNLLHSVTLEEATSSPRAWINQRSRWQKGYAITWYVHMRQPMRLVSELGVWRFAGFQLLFVGSLGSALLAPVLWSFWLLMFDLPHPLRGVLDGKAAFAVMATLFASLTVNALAQFLALRRIRALSLAGAIPLMHAYHSLATIALCKALWELMFRPFFWHKTAHGVTPPDARITMTDPDPNHV